VISDEENAQFEDVHAEAPTKPHVEDESYLGGKWISLYMLHNDHMTR